GVVGGGGGGGSRQEAGVVRPTFAFQRSRKPSQASIPQGGAGRGNKASLASVARTPVSRASFGKTTSGSTQWMEAPATTRSNGADSSKSSARAHTQRTLAGPPMTRAAAIIPSDGSSPTTSSKCAASSRATGPGPQP